MVFTSASLVPDYGRRMVDLRLEVLRGGRWSIRIEPSDPIDWFGTLKL